MDFFKIRNGGVKKPKFNATVEIPKSFLTTTLSKGVYTNEEDPFKKYVDFLVDRLTLEDQKKYARISINGILRSVDVHSFMNESHIGVHMNCFATANGVLKIALLLANSGNTSENFSDLSVLKIKKLIDTEAKKEIVTDIRISRPGDPFFSEESLPKTQTPITGVCCMLVFYITV